MSGVVDIEQLLMLLELEAPFDQREVQLARRRMAKRWHPDLAPPGRRSEHERHIKLINEGADQLEELAEQSREGFITKSAVAASAAAMRRARAEAGRRAYEARQRQSQQTDSKNDPFAGHVPDHSVVHRYARCLSYPEWGVGSVSGVHFSGEGEHVQQWARVLFSIGVRTVPAGSLQFVDFAKPDLASDRLARFVTAAQHSMAEGDFKLAAKRLIYARDADPKDVSVLRLLTFALWRAGDHLAAGRSVRDWMRVEADNPMVYRYAARVYESMGARVLAIEALQRLLKLRPKDGVAWAKLGRFYLERFELNLAIEALLNAGRFAPSLEIMLDLALAYKLRGDSSSELAVYRQAVKLEPQSFEAWSSYAHALSVTERLADCLAACKSGLAIVPDDDELTELRVRIDQLQVRTLTAGA